MNLLMTLRKCYIKKEQHELSMDNKKREVNLTNQYLLLISTSMDYIKFSFIKI